MINFFGITWANPDYSWFLPFIIGGIIVCLYGMQRRIRYIQLLSGIHNNVMVGYSKIKLYSKVLFISLALISLWIALLRPQWHKRNTVVAQEGRDVLIALDISRSMLATDVKPNRLEKAKQKIKQLLSQLECERVGLILFSGSAFVQCPLTNDYSAFYMFLDHVDAESISSGSTALDEALKQALTLYSQSSKKTKLLVIYTDGEDFSHNLKQYKAKAQEQGLHVFTVGMGTQEGAPIPLYDATGKMVGHQKDAKGNVVITQLNEPVLHSLAKDAGGVYIPLSNDNKDIQMLKSRIMRYEKEKFEDKEISQYDDKYHYLLGISFILFALEWLL